MAQQHRAAPPPLKTEEDYIPYPSVHEVLGREGPFPLILLPQFGGYWIEGTNHQLSGAPEPPPNPAPGTRVRLEGNHTAKIYRKHFLGKEHFNYYSLDPALGHLVFSLKYDEQEHLHLLLRTRTRTLHDVVPISCLAEFPNVVQMAKLVCEDINVDRFYPVLYPKASRLILAFDEHVLSNHFKFGVIYQKLGQVPGCGVRVGIWGGGPGGTHCCPRRPQRKSSLAPRRRAQRSPSSSTSWGSGCSSVTSRAFGEGWM